jgi:hypothetical protein
MNKEIENKETKEIVIGDFKPKRTFLSFISSVNSAKVRFTRNTAFIKGEKLSGILEGTIFKITICDEGTIKFEEESTNLSNKEMIQRFIDEIDEINTVGYAQKYIVSGLDFKDVDGNLCYLEVEQSKPIDKLKILIEESSDKRKVSDKGLSVLDMLFPDDDTNTTEVEEEQELEVVKNTNQYSSYIEESIKKMNDEKVKELKQRIEETQKEITKQKNDITQSETRIKQFKEKLGVLETRLSSLQIEEVFNGYVFNVSEQKKNNIELDENSKDIAGKIADIMNLKKDVLFDMLTEGYYVIKIAKKNSDYLKNMNTSDLNEEEIENLKESLKELTEIQKTIITIDIDGKFSLDDNGDLEYRGKLNWHQLISKMIQKGFEQDVNFDKVVNNNEEEII